MSSPCSLSLSLIETTTQRVLRGNWRSSNAGGSHIESPGKWTINPMYSLRVAAETTVDITLERPSNKWKGATKINTLESMMGFYVLQGEAPGQRLRPERARECIVHQTVRCPPFASRDISCHASSFTLRVTPRMAGLSAGARGEGEPLPRPVAKWGAVHHHARHVWSGPARALLSWSQHGHSMRTRVAPRSVGRGLRAA